MKNIFKSIKLISGSIILSYLVVSCNPQKNIAGNYNTYETECLGSEMDGSQTLRAFGKGKDKEDAIDQARKNALRDVIFSGIRKGSDQCELRPLTSQPNAKEKHEAYFNSFFKDGGKYKEFCTDEDGISKTKYKATGTEVMFGVNVRVLRSKLKQQLLDDNILN